MLRRRSLLASRYRLEARLGAGGMGDVWRARDERSGQVVAVKRLHPGAARDSSLRRRFEREIRVIRELEHPGIVRILDVFEHEDLPGYAMELLEGETLRAVLDREAPLEPDRALALMLPVVDSLEAVHSAGVVHRDLKPENVFIDSRGGRPRVKVLDFGVAKLLPGGPLGTGTALTGAAALVGTLAYMAPEQLTASDRVGRAVDVWALGVILYEALAGARPIEGDNETQLVSRILTEAIVPLQIVAPSVPSRLAAIITRMLSRDTESRPADLSAVRAGLQSASEGV